MYIKAVSQARLCVIICIVHSLALILFIFLILQYIAANPGVQGAYMPQYPPLQAPPVSLSYPVLVQIFIHLFPRNNNSFRKIITPHANPVHFHSGGLGFVLKCWSCETINYLSANAVKAVIITF